MTITEITPHDAPRSDALPAFIWTNAGSHDGETLPQIVARKQQDIRQFGWCLWAYAGGGGPAHPEKQIRQLARRAGSDSLAVLLPDSGRVDPTGAPYSSFVTTKGGLRAPLPAGMSPVTGAAGAWALVLDSLEWADITVDVGVFDAPFAAGGPKPLSLYLRGSHGRACALRTSDAGRGSDLRHIALVGRTRAPHAVYLSD